MIKIEAVFINKAIIHAASRRPDVFAQLDDETLLAEAAAGSHPHFEALIRRYAASVYRVAFRLTGSRETAEDISQESFVKIFKALPGARTDLPFKPWLFKIVVNTALSYRRKKRLTRVQADFHDGPASDSIDVTEAVADRNDIQSAIDRLPLKDRQVVVLRAVEELSFREIAQALDIPEATARTRFARAKEKLKKLFFSE